LGFAITSNVKRNRYIERSLVLSGYVPMERFSPTPPHHATGNSVLGGDGYGRAIGGVHKQQFAARDLWLNDRVVVDFGVGEPGFFEVYRADWR
jgi:hypothetical protein